MIIVLGLDGADPKILRKYLPTLPNFSKLMKEGVFGELAAPIPSVTLPAWLSFETGKNLGKLGVYMLWKRKEGSFDVEPINPANVKSQKIWDVLGQHGKTTGVFAMPGTYPGLAINGFIVSSPFTGTKEPNIYPESLKPEIKKLGFKEMGMIYGNDQVLEETKELLDIQFRTAKYLMEKRPDVLLLYFPQIDHVCHMVGKKPEIRDRELQNVYKRCDEVLGGVLEGMRKGDTLFVMSDHGFRFPNKAFYFSNWLRKEGLLELKNPRELRIKSLIRKHTRKFLAFLHLSHTLDFVPKKVKNTLSPLPSRNPKNINWQHTKAFAIQSATCSPSIYINLKGREPYGIVEPGEEYESVRDEIISGLRELGFKAFKREELYSGPYVEEAPDITFLTEGTDFAGYSAVPCDKLILELPLGTHANYGIFFAYGNSITKGVTLNNADIKDVMPSILHLLDLPIPGDVDGKVLDIFTFDRKIKCGSAEGEMTEEEKELSEEEKHRIKNRLEALGYLD